MRSNPSAWFAVLVATVVAPMMVAPHLFSDDRFRLAILAMFFAASLMFAYAALFGRADRIRVPGSLTARLGNTLSIYMLGVLLMLALAATAIPVQVLVSLEFAWIAMLVVALVRLFSTAVDPMPHRAWINEEHIAVIVSLVYQLRRQLSQLSHDDIEAMQAVLDDIQKTAIAAGARAGGLSREDTRDIVISLQRLDDEVRKFIGTGCEAQGSDVQASFARAQRDVRLVINERNQG